jgi:hypothetical protein
MFRSFWQKNTLRPGVSGVRSVSVALLPVILTSREEDFGQVAAQ